MLKQAYEMGVRAALEEVGLTKEAGLRSLLRDLYHGPAVIGQRIVGNTPADLQAVAKALRGETALAAPTGIVEKLVSKAVPQGSRRARFMASNLEETARRM